MTSASQKSCSASRKKFRKEKRKKMKKKFKDFTNVLLREQSSSQVNLDDEISGENQRSKSNHRITLVQLSFVCHEAIINVQQIALLRLHLYDCIIPFYTALQYLQYNHILFVVVVCFCVCALFLSKFVTNYLSSYNLHLVAGNSINYPSIFAIISGIYFWKSLQSILSSVLTSLELVTLRRRTHCAISLTSSKRNLYLLTY